MCLIDDFFLDKERIRKVVKNKIEGELHFGFAARQGLDGALPQCFPPYGSLLPQFMA
jgi:hypothetical protein